MSVTSCTASTFDLASLVQALVSPTGLAAFAPQTTAGRLLAASTLAAAAANGSTLAIWIFIAFIGGHKSLSLQAAGDRMVPIAAHGHSSQITRATDGGVATQIQLVRDLRAHSAGC